MENKICSGEGFNIFAFVSAEAAQMTKHRKRKQPPAIYAFRFEPLKNK